jgi:hypothetical protein
MHEESRALLVAVAKFRDDKNLVVGANCPCDRPIFNVTALFELFLAYERDLCGFDHCMTLLMDNHVSNWVRDLAEEFIEAQSSRILVGGKGEEVLCECRLQRMMKGVCFVDWQRRYDNAERFDFPTILERESVRKEVASVDEVPNTLSEGAL